MSAGRDAEGDFPSSVVLALDVGTRNLAYAVIRYQRGVGTTLFTAELLASERVDIVQEGVQTGVLTEDPREMDATSVRGETLARCLFFAMASRVPRFRELAPDMVVIEEQPGYSPRGKNPAAQAHGLKMNNMAYALYTFFLGVFDHRNVVFRNTRRKEMGMRCLCPELFPEDAPEAKVSEGSGGSESSESKGSEEEVGGTYDGSKHDRNKAISEACVLRVLNGQGGTVRTKTPLGKAKLISLCPCKEKGQRAKLAFATRLVRWELVDRCEATQTMTKGKTDDRADAIWHALEVICEAHDLVPPPSYAAPKKKVKRTKTTGSKTKSPKEPKATRETKKRARTTSVTLTASEELY